MVFNIEFLGTLARDTFVSKRIGQSDAVQTVSSAKVSLAKVSQVKLSLWPKLLSGQSAPVIVSLANVSFWPNCDST